MENMTTKKNHFPNTSIYFKNQKKILEKVNKP